MASGSHLSKEMYELIKAIGDARSKQEEDKIISNEAHSLGSKFKQPTQPLKQLKENIVRAMYVELLGHDASFAYVPTINNCANKNLQLKRVAYLGSTLFLRQDSKSLILMISTLQKDLSSKNSQEVLAALTTLCKILYPEIVAGISNSVLNLLNHSNSQVKKKACIVALKLYQLSPSNRSEIDTSMKKALCDKDPCVIAASLNYFYELSKTAPSKCKELISSFVSILKQIIEHRLPKDYDYHRMPAPWIQMQLLSILGILGKYDKESSEHMYEVLSLVLRRADDMGINISYAVVYQCLMTIASIYPYKSLIELASSTISRFLSTENKNLRYIGITGLSFIVDINPEYVHQHLNVVVDCLEDKDETLKSKTISLLFKMANIKNVVVIVEKLLNYLKQTTPESHFRKDVIMKIQQLAEKFAVNCEWYIKVMLSLFEQGGSYVPSEVWNSFFKVFKEWETLPEANSLYKTAIDALFNQLKTKTIFSQAILETMCFVFGEYAPVICSREDMITIIKLLSKVGMSKLSVIQTLPTMISSIMKIHSNLNFIPIDEVNSLIQQHKNSRNLEIQQRCLEYISIKDNKEDQNVKFSEFFKPPTNMDFSLQFLDSYITSINCRPYNESKSKLLKFPKREKSINFEPYHNMDQRPKFISENIKEKNLNLPQTLNTKEEITLNVPKKWTSQGYVGDQLQDNKNTSNLNDLKDSKGDNNLKNVGRTIQNTKSIDYKDYPQNGSELDIRKPQKEIKKKVPEENKEKELLMSKLSESFGGPSIETNPTHVATTEKKVASSLLEIDFDSNISNNENTKLDFNILPEITKTVEKPYFNKLQITTEDFANIWTSLENEKNG